MIPDDDQIYRWSRAVEVGAVFVLGWVFGVIGMWLVTH